MVEAEILKALHPWLVQNLVGTELGAEDLANYVISLLEPGGSREELKERLTSDLQEFLFDSTGDFVDACLAEIERIHTGDSAQQHASQQAPGYPPQGPPMVEAQGGQAEFRQNFRRQQPPQQGMPPFPGFPPQGFNPQNFNPQGMPPFDMGGFPPHGGNGYNNNSRGNFRGGNRGGRGGFRQNQYGNNQYGNNQYGQNNGQRKYSSMSSIQNELSMANRSLIVEKIPDDKLNEDSVRSFFGKFGNLKAVKIDHNQHLAEIEFEAHDQASAAHSSPDPIFDNRFVKVYWRKKMDNEPQPVVDVESAKRMLLIKQQQIAEKEAKRKEITIKIREVLNAQAGLLQERQALLQANASQETLDAQSQRTEQLKTRLLELQNEATGLGLPQPSAGRGGFRGGYRGRGFSPYSRGGPRGAFRGGRGGGRAAIAQASLDLRPKAVLIRGVPADKEEVLRGHLASSNYNALERQGPDVVIVDFADRRSAEQFYSSDLADIGPVNRTFTRYSGPSNTGVTATMDES